MTVPDATGFPDTIVLAESPVSGRAAAAESGNSAPGSGKALPVSLPDHPLPDARKLAEALEDASRRAGRTLRFEPDPDGGLAVIYVLDRATGELIRRIPAADVVRTMAPDGSLDLRLVDDRA